MNLSPTEIMKIVYSTRPNKREWSELSLLRGDGSPRYISTEVKKGRNKTYLLVTMIYRQLRDERVYKSITVQDGRDGLYLAYREMVRELARAAKLTAAQIKIVHEGYDAFHRRNIAKYQKVFG